MTRKTARRLLAALIIASALFGLAVQFSATVSANGAVVRSIWILLRYFTIITNILVAVIFAVRALHPARFDSAWLRGGIVLTMLLVAIVYQAVLAGTLVQTGPERLADLFLHRVTPALVIVDWVIGAPRGDLRWRDPMGWAVLPILYLIYALARGAADGIYPYPFLDVGRFGAVRVATNAVVIAIGFLMAGLALVSLDRRLGRRGG